MRIAYTSNFAPVTFILPRYLWNSPPHNRIPRSQNLVPGTECLLSIASSLFHSIAPSLFRAIVLSFYRSFALSFNLNQSTNHPINQSPIPLYTLYPYILYTPIYSIRPIPLYPYSLYFRAFKIPSAITLCIN